MRAGIADYTRTLCPAWSAVCGSALIQVRARAGIQPGWAGIAGDKPGAALAIVASLGVDAGPVNARNKNVGRVMHGLSITDYLYTHTGHQISRWDLVVEANESEQSGYGCVCIYIYNR